MLRLAINTLQGRTRVVNEEIPFDVAVGRLKGLEFDPHQSDVRVVFWDTMITYSSLVVDDLDFKLSDAVKNFEGSKEEPDTVRHQVFVDKKGRERHYLDYRFQNITAQYFTN
jgi:hypothetical protein